MLITLHTGAYMSIAIMNLRLLVKKKERRLYIFVAYTALTTVITTAFHWIFVYDLLGVYTGARLEGGLQSSVRPAEVVINSLFVLNTFLADALLVRILFRWSVCL
jgi:hypothetical protein